MIVMTRMLNSSGRQATRPGSTTRASSKVTTVSALFSCRFWYLTLFVTRHFRFTTRDELKQKYSRVWVPILLKVLDDVRKLPAALLRSYRGEGRDYLHIGDIWKWKPRVQYGGHPQQCIFYATELADRCFGGKLRGRHRRCKCSPQVFERPQSGRPLCFDLGGTCSWPDHKACARFSYSFHWEW